MKVNDLMTGRNEGLAMALRIVKEGGIEALEKEIRYRNISGISLNLTEKEIQNASYKAHLRATEVAIAISLVTLMDEFYFSRSQMHKFKAAFDENVYKAANSDRSMDILQEYIDKIREDVGIEISIKD
jgi:arginyl-tRNA--protein-N-Asp/Glu arginylyltransferase